MIKLINILSEIKNLGKITPKIVFNYYDNLLQKNNDELDQKLRNLIIQKWKYDSHMFGTVQNFIDFLGDNEWENAKEKLAEFFRDLQNLDKDNIQESSPDQFEFEYSETGNQFEFGLRDISEQEFAAEAVGILNGKDLYIESIGTNSKYRRKGLGSKLLDYIIDFAKERQIIKIDLEVRSSNKSAINLYNKFGFNPVDKRRGNTLDKMELVLEIKSSSHVTPDMAEELYKKIMATDDDISESILQIFMDHGYQDYLENETQPGRDYNFYKYLRDKNKLNQFYSDLSKFK